MNEKSKQRLGGKSCNNPELGALLVFFLNDDITKKQSEQVEEHLSQCKLCAEEFQFLVKAQQVLSEDLYAVHG